MSTIFVCLLIALAAHERTWAAPQPAAQPAETLTLEKAIARAMNTNPTIVDRRLQQELNEIAYDNAWSAMFVPRISLGVLASETQTMGQVHRSAAQVTGPTARDRALPSAGVQLSVGEFTVYNFGRDKDRYEIAKTIYDRSKQSLRETERQVRFDVTDKFLNLKTAQDLLDVSNRSVLTAESIVNLLKSRIALGKASQSDVASAEVDLINAKNTLLSAENAYRQKLWALNLALGDPIDRNYRVLGELKVEKLELSLEEALRIYKENSPAVRDASATLDQARINLRFVEKSFLPLPTITFSGVGIGYNFTPTGTSPIRSTSNNGNLNWTATLNLTIPIVGDGGLFGHRQIREAEVAVERAELTLRNSANQTEVSVRTLYSSIISGETTIANNEKLFKGATTVFESALSSLQRSPQFNRLDLKNAVEQLRNAELDLSNSILQYNSLKFSLAQLIGVDELKGAH